MVSNISYVCTQYGYVRVQVCVRVGVRRPAVFVFGRRLPAEDAPPESSSVVVVIIIIIEFDVFRIGAVTVFVHP